MGFSGMWARIFFLLAQKIRAHQQSKEVIPLNHSPAFRRMLAPVLALALVCTLSLPASAFFWNKKTDVPSVSDFSKTAWWGRSFLFCRGLPCLRRQRWDRAGRHYAENSARYRHRDAHRRRTAPDRGRPGGRLRPERAPVPSSAHPSVNETAFTFLPSFTTGETGEEVTVTLYLLTEANEAPIARNMDLSTYKNVAITGWFDAEGRRRGLPHLPAHLHPARGP